jgi:hypothetical protein
VPDLNPHGGEAARRAQTGPASRIQLPSIEFTYDLEEFTRHFKRDLSIVKREVNAINFSGRWLDHDSGFIAAFKLPLRRIWIIHRAKFQVVISGAWFANESYYGIFHLNLAWIQI